MRPSRLVRHSWAFTAKLPITGLIFLSRTRTVSGSDYSPAIELSEQKDKLVTATGDTDKYSEKQANKASRTYLRTKVTPDLHLTYSKNGGNLGLVLNDNTWKFLHKFICCGDLLEPPPGGDSNR